MIGWYFACHNRFFSNIVSYLTWNRVRLSSATWDPRLFHASAHAKFAAPLGTWNMLLIIFAGCGVAHSRVFRKIHRDYNFYRIFRLCNERWNGLTYFPIHFSGILLYLWSIMERDSRPPLGAPETESPCLWICSCWQYSTNENKRETYKNRRFQISRTLTGCLQQSSCVWKAYIVIFTRCLPSATWDPGVLCITCKECVRRLTFSQYWQLVKVQEQVRYQRISFLNDLKRNWSVVSVYVDTSTAWLLPTTWDPGWLGNGPQIEFVVKCWEGIQFLSDLRWCDGR